MTSSWFSLSTLNYDARSTTHQILNLCSSFCARNQVYSSVHFNPYIHRQHIGDKVSGLDGSKYSLRHHATIIYIYIKKTERKKERKKEKQQQQHFGSKLKREHQFCEMKLSMF